MTEQEKYAEIYRDPQTVTAADRAAFGAIWRGVWGDDLAYELAPANFLTWSELRRIAEELRVAPGARILDVGCGRGGPGLWIAEQVRAGVVGIDSSPEGCAAAHERAATEHVGVPAEYHVADMTATGLADRSADAAISLDAVQIVPSRPAAFREIARLLRSSARFVLATFDHPGEMPAGSLMPGRERVRDSRPLLEEAGFRVLAYDRIRIWDERAVATYRALLDQRETVAAVAGEAMIREAEWGVAHAQRSVHLFVVCERAA